MICICWLTIHQYYINSEYRNEEKNNKDNMRTKRDEIICSLLSKEISTIKNTIEAREQENRTLLQQIQNVQKEMCQFGAAAPLDCYIPDQPDILH